MNYNEIVKKLLELETLNKLKVVNINSSEDKIQIEVKDKMLFVFFGMNIIRVVERKYIEYENGNSTVKYTDAIVFNDLEQLEEFFKNMNIEELTYEEKIKQTIKRVLDKEILSGKKISNKIEEKNGNGYYTSSINGDAFRIETIFNENKCIEITFTYKDEVEKLHLECETNKKTNSAYIIYDKFVNDISVIRYSIYDNVYDINVLSRFFKAMKIVSNSYFGNLMYLIVEAIGGENENKN